MYTSNVIDGKRDAAQDRALGSEPDYGQRPASDADAETEKPLIEACISN